MELQLLADRFGKIFVSNLYSDQPKPLSGQIHGSSLGLAVTLVDRLPLAASDNRIWEPLDISGWGSLTVSVGQGFKLPAAGVFPIRSGIDQTTGPLVVGKRYKIVAFVGGDNFTNVGAASNASGVYFVATGTNPTTWTHFSNLQECTVNISHTALVDDVQEALDNTHFISQAGGVTVELEAAGYLTFTFLENGVQSEMIADADNLAPLSVLDFGTLVDGGADLAEVQSLRIVQAPAAKAIFTDPLPAGDLVVTTLTVGSGAGNHKIRIKADPQIYAGTYTLTVGGGESDFIDLTSDAPTLKAKLEALESVGAGNVSVTKEQPGSWVAMFIGEKANTDMGDITRDASGLKSLPGFRGSILFDNASIELLLAGQDEVTCGLQIEGTPPGAPAPEVVYRVDNFVLLDSINDPSSNSPAPRAQFWNKEESDARYAAKNGTNYRVTDLGKIQLKNANGLYQSISLDVNGGLVTGAEEA